MSVHAISSWWWRGQAQAGGYTILADGDDGHERLDTNALNTASVVAGDAGTYLAAAFWRFTGIAVPIGSTITSATITVTSSASGGSGTAVIRAQKSASPAAVSAGNLPSSWTGASGTTATTAITGAAAGVNVYDVTDIVQELVDQAGWPSTGGAMNFRMAEDAGGFYTAFVDSPSAGSAVLLISAGDVDYHIDPSFGAGGNGTLTMPWDDFTEVNALTGNLGGVHIKLKSGQVIYDQLVLGNASNFTVETYGGSPQAIIDGSDVGGFSWTDHTGTQPGIWSTGTTQLAIIADSEWLRFARIGSASDQQALLDRMEFSSWVGTHSVIGGGSRFYIHLPSGMNPNTLQGANNLRYSNRSFCADLFACADATIQNVTFRRGNAHCFRINSTGHRITLEGNTFEQAGGAGATGNLLNITGLVGDVTTGNVVRNNTFRYAYHNALEFGYSDGLLIERNTLEHTGDNCFELWQSATNTIIRRNIDLGHGGSFFWSANDAGGQHHQNTQVYNNISRSIGNWMSSLSQPGGTFAKLQNGSNGRVYNNTSVSHAQNAVQVTAATTGGSNNVWYIKNNILMLTCARTDAYRIQSTDTPTPNWTADSTASGASNQIVSDANVWTALRNATPSTQKMYYLNGSGANGLANWQAFSGNPEATFGSEANTSMTAPFGTATVTTATTNAVAADGTFSLSFASHSFARGDWLYWPGTTSPRVNFQRVCAANATTVYFESTIGATASGTTVTKMDASLSGSNFTPTAVALNNGIGNDTDASVPTVDFNGNARSATTPDIGAIEV